MDEIKSKVIRFVRKQGPHGSSELNENVIDDSEAIRNSVVVRSKPIEEPIEEIEDEEVLKQIPKYYFDASPTFDIQHHLLKELPADIKCLDIKLKLRTLYRQHGVVSKNTLRQILEKESMCSAELERIEEIQNDLAVALGVCQGSRYELNSAKSKFTSKSLGIIKNFKRKQVIYELLRNLKTIRTLQKSDERLQELLKEGDFSGAIRLLLESQNVAVSLKHFKCVAQLSWKLQDTLESTEGQLDVVLCQMCKCFNDVTYSKLQEAYGLLDKTQAVMDQLLMHFTSELHSSVFKIVHRFAPPSSTKNFHQLCKCVPSKEYVACLQVMCQEVWQILNSYYKVIQWHQQNDRETSTKPGGNLTNGTEIKFVPDRFEAKVLLPWDPSKLISTITPPKQTGELLEVRKNISRGGPNEILVNVLLPNRTCLLDIPGRDIERSLNKNYIKQKLENGQTRLWNEAQARICSYIMGYDFSDCKFEDLLKILGLLQRLMEIGDELCGSQSEEISKCIRQQTINYFQSYHGAKLEELRIFLENEVWTQCPVRPKFSLVNLQEFKSLRHTIENHRRPKRGHLDSSQKDNDIHNSSSNLSTEGSSCQNVSYFSRFPDSATPFDSLLEETCQEDILNNVEDDFSGYYSVSSEDSDSEELKKAFVEDNPNPAVGQPKKKKEKKIKNKSTGPIVANTTLTVLRHCGKYLQMCRLLKPIALDVILCMCQLFDYYLYNVFHFFTSDLTIKSSKMVSFKLQAALKRIEDNLILKNSSEEAPQDNKRRIVASHKSEMVNLQLKESLHGLAERAVGVESLIFLGSQFEYIQQYVLHLVPEEKKHFIDQFYSQTVACVTDVRCAAYMCVSAHVVDMRSTVEKMKKVDFNVKEIPSEHSPYIDKIVEDMQSFSKRLEEFELDIPIETELVLWENIMHMVNNIVVEGFASARKCSNGGRALMLLDYTQLVSKVLKLTPLQRIPNEDYVEGYIKAFYIQENMLEEWITQHREYTPKQLESLMYCVCPNSKRTKQRLLQMLDLNK